MRGWALAAVLAVLAGEWSAGAAAAADPAWGLGARVGSFGVPGAILDRFFDEHPAVTGEIVGGEIRYYGDGGPRGALSLGLTADRGSASADGVWRRHPDDGTVTARGEVTLLAVTLTGYWDLFAASPLHPYLGLGLGYARMRGHYREQEEEGDIRIAEDLPAVHIPLGLTLRLGRYCTLRGEARFINGISFGGGLMLNF
jgi:hypothetical protein